MEDLVAQKREQVHPDVPIEKLLAVKNNQNLISQREQFM